MNTKVKSVLNSILERFKTGDIAEPIAMSMFPIADTPSARWSLTNRTLMFMAGTSDGRGFKQWQTVNRYVKKGSKAFHILVPHVKKVEENGQERAIIRGFGIMPVFRFEDTDGEQLGYENIPLPDLPLIERAVEWGIDVKAVPGNYSYYGYFSSSRKEICLATPEERTFFHELSHVAHERIIGTLKGGQDPLQETVAELSGQVLCQIVGKTGSDTTTMGNSYRYIEKYADKLKMSVHTACMKVLSDTEKVLNLILGTEAAAKVICKT